LHFNNFFPYPFIFIKQHVKNNKSFSLHLPEKRRVMACDMQFLNEVKLMDNKET